VKTVTLSDGSVVEVKVYEPQKVPDAGVNMKIKGRQRRLSGGGKNGSASGDLYMMSPEDKEKQVAKELERVEKEKQKLKKGA